MIKAGWKNGDGCSTVKGGEMDADMRENLNLETCQNQIVVFFGNDRK